LRVGLEEKGVSECIAEVDANGYAIGRFQQLRQTGSTSLLETTERGRFIEVAPNVRIYCAEDDFSDGWLKPDAILMIHGIAEHGGIWRGWVPRLARHYHVLRPDLRGFGRSSLMPSDGSFTLTDWADDLEALLRALQHKRVHLVATKVGAQVAFELAQRQLPNIASMTLAGMLPSPSAALGASLGDLLQRIEQHGVENWARTTMRGRMGSTLSDVAMAWWIALMAEAPLPSVLTSMRMLSGLHGPRFPERVACPTLFITAGQKPAADNYNQQPDQADMDRLIARVPGARSCSIEADSFHIAATHPDRCALHTADFIKTVKRPTMSPNRILPRIK
jgi:3-oxoadipate enol-lactonase